VQGLVRTARSLVKTGAPCGAGGSTPRGGPGRCFRIREEGQNSALAPDVPIGMAFARHCHVRFLFWLCKRTAAAVEDPIKLGSLSPGEPEFGTSNLSSKLRSA
jgi:hypothetical protein